MTFQLSRQEGDTNKAGGGGTNHDNEEDRDEGAEGTEVTGKAGGINYKGKV